MLHIKWFLSNFRKGVETTQYLLAVRGFCLHWERLEKQLNMFREIVIHELLLCLFFKLRRGQVKTSHIDGFCFLFKAGKQQFRAL